MKGWHGDLPAAKALYAMIGLDRPATIAEILQGCNDVVGSTKDLHNAIATCVKRGFAERVGHGNPARYQATESGRAQSLLDERELTQRKV